MNDILFGSNNKAIVKKLSKRSFQQNKIRNSIAALAIFLTTLLICTIFLPERMGRQEGEKGV